VRFSGWKQFFPLAERFHRNRKSRGVYHALPLKLHPDFVYRLARKEDVELDLRTAIRPGVRPRVSKDRMLVDAVDQIVAHGENGVPTAPDTVQRPRPVPAEKNSIVFLPGMGSGGSMCNETVTFSACFALKSGALDARSTRPIDLSYPAVAR